MMMRRVQTAACVSGGGEGGASELLDNSDASGVIFVSCNASAIVAERREVLVGSPLSSLYCFAKPSRFSCFEGELQVVSTPPSTAC